jgi:hypothetical protein
MAMQQRVIVYVDGFNLYYGMMEGGLERCKWLDLIRLATEFLKPSQQLIETNYFTSRINGNPPAQKRQNTYIEALQATGVLVTFGQFQSVSEKCKACGNDWFKQNEKMTDVNIATKMLSDAFQDRFDIAFLISGDTDLVPPIREIHRLFPKKSVTVLFPPKRQNTAVAKQAKGSMIIGRKNLVDSQFPERVTKSDGYVLRRPVEWNP